jgi:NADPH:quinone reductase
VRAAWYDSVGAAAEVLRVGEVADPEPGPGQVRVHVHASGVNPADIKRRSGWRGMAMEFPRQIPHDDGAGVVDAVGPGVNSALVGQRVWLYDTRVGRPGGSAAEFVCVPSANIEPLPDGASFAEGACLGIPGRTAHRCLFRDGSIKGATILVAGAAGAVGHTAVQQAKRSGATVIGTVGREENRALAEAAGCDLVLDYKNDDVHAAVRDMTGGHGVDRIIEVDIAANIALDVRCIAVNGVISGYSTNTSPSPTVPVSSLLESSATLRVELVYHLPSEAHRQAADDLHRWLAAGEISMRIGKRFGLADIALAHEAVENGRGQGNVVIDVVDSEKAVPR